MPRPQELFPLFADIQNLPGVGNRIAAQFARLKITRIKDLLFLLPLRIEEWVDVERALSSYLDELITVEGVVLAHHQGRNKQSPYIVRLGTDFGVIELVFFGASSYTAQKKLPIEHKVKIQGKLKMDYGEWQIIQPQIYEITDNPPKIAPVYPLTEGINQAKMRKSVQAALAHIPAFPDWLSKDFLKAQNWPRFHEAIAQLHNPQSQADILPQSPLRMRLAFDEILAFQAGIIHKGQDIKHARAPALPISAAVLEKGKSLLPFALTKSQDAVMSEILRDLSGEFVMYRLLQGDVGAGKTVIAYLTALAVISQGGQVALLAPTEILARQHYEFFAPLLEAQGYRTLFLTGSIKDKEKRALHGEIAQNSVEMIIGTHAIFQDAVQYHDLRLAIIDEQHRFGVNERKRLLDKGENVDLLALSATPIPRSLALTIYGDMDLSILSEKPKGRLPIHTAIVNVNKLENLVERMAGILAEGRKIYWVCSLVEENESLDFAAANARYAYLVKRFGKERVGLVHGQMKAEDKLAETQRFAFGDCQILVATTVIEVGIDVPDASVMVIENAERFGLSQLHQLRGRIGRGAQKSDCILLYQGPLSEFAQERLSLIRQSQDGFFLAEEDLRLRGSGDMMGLAQSGLPDFHFVDPAFHNHLFSQAREMAKSDWQSDEGQARLAVLMGLFERWDYIQA